MATTINTYSVGLSLNASDYIDKSRLSATETRKLTATINQARNPAEKYARDLELLDKAVKHAAIELPVYNRLVDELAKKHKQGAYSAEAVAAAEAKKTAELNKATLATQRQAEADAKLQKGVDQLVAKEERQERMLRNLNQARAASRAEKERETHTNIGLSRSIAGLASGYAAFAGLRSGVKIASDMEQAKISFEIMTGSAETGLKMFADIRKFAASTPITLPGAQSAARTMLAFGVANEKIMPSLKALGDISGGNDERFRGLALAFSQTAATGRLMGQEVLQMVNAGFNPLQEISRTTGRSMVDLKKDMENGAISAAMVEQAMISATSGTGRFTGMMDRMAKTAAGSYNQLSSAVQEIVGLIGEKFLPALAASAQATEKLIRFVFGWSSILQKPNAQLLAMSVAFVTTAMVAPRVISAIVGITKAIQAMTKAQVVAMAFTGPKGWAIIASSAAAAAGALWAVNKAYEGITDEAEAAGNAAESANAKMAKAAKGVQSQQKQLDPLTREFLKMEHSLSEQVKLANLGEDAYRRQQMYIKGMSMEQVKRIDELHEQLRLAERMKEQSAEADRNRQQAIEKLKRDAEEAFTRQTTAALDAAHRIFDQRRKLEEDARKRLIAGSSTLEVGGAEAAKFMAERANERLAVAKMPAVPTPGEAAIANEAAKQYAEIVKQTQQNERQLMALQELVAVGKENGFKRYR